MTRGFGDKADIDFECMQIDALQNIANYSNNDADPFFNWSDTCVGYSAPSGISAAVHIAANTIN